MQLDVADIQVMLDRHFAGNILYQPVHRTESNLPRPLAQLVPCTQILKSIASAEPLSLDRKHSALMLQGLLHHEIAPPVRKR